MTNINLITIIISFIDLFCLFCRYLRKLCKQSNFFNKLFFSIYLQQNESIFSYNNRYYYQFNNFIKDNTSLLDIGCNRGIIKKVIKNIDYTGIDTNESFCKPDIFNISFKEFKTTRKFDHKLLVLLNNNGIIYLKSHQLPDYKLDTMLDLLKKKNSTKIIYNETVYLKCELHKRRLVYVQYIKDSE